GRDHHCTQLGVTLPLTIPLRRDKGTKVKEFRVEQQVVAALDLERGKCGAALVLPEAERGLALKQGVIGKEYLLGLWSGVLDLDTSQALLPDGVPRDQDALHCPPKPDSLESLRNPVVLDKDTA